eukprot:5134371-Pyramimonas_sp.AAC.1
MATTHVSTPRPSAKRYGAARAGRGLGEDNERMIWGQMCIMRGIGWGWTGKSWGSLGIDWGCDGGGIWLRIGVQRARGLGHDWERIQG